MVALPVKLLRQPVLRIFPGECAVAWRTAWTSSLVCRYYLFTFIFTFSDVRILKGFIHSI